MRILSNKKNIIIIAAVVLIIILLLTLCGKDDKAKAESVAKNFIEYLVKGNTSKAAALMSDLAVEESGSATRKIFESKFANTTQNRFSNISVTKIKVVDSYFDEVIDPYNPIYGYDVVRTVLEYSYEKERLFTDEKGTGNLTVTVIKEGNSWRVYHCA